MIVFARVRERLVVVGARGSERTEGMGTVSRLLRIARGPFGVARLAPMECQDLRRRVRGLRARRNALVNRRPFGCEHGVVNDASHDLAHEGKTRDSISIFVDERRVARLAQSRKRGTAIDLGNRTEFVEFERAPDDGCDFEQTLA